MAQVKNIKGSFYFNKMSFTQEIHGMQGHMTSWLVLHYLCHNGFYFQAHPTLLILTFSLLFQKESLSCWAWVAQN